MKGYGDRLVTHLSVHFCAFTKFVCHYYDIMGAKRWFSNTEQCNNSCLKCLRHKIKAHIAPVTQNVVLHIQSRCFFPLLCSGKGEDAASHMGSVTAPRSTPDSTSTHQKSIYTLIPSSCKESFC